MESTAASVQGKSPCSTCLLPLPVCPRKGGGRGERRREREEGRKEREGEGRREKEAGGRHNLSKPYTDKKCWL